MIGLGTIVNCGTVLAGASIGMLLKNGLSKRFEETIMQGIGLCTMFIGIGGAVSTLLTIEDGKFSTQHTMLLILCLALGALIGEALNIEKHLEDFGVFCQNRLKSSGDSHFVEGFVSFSLLICIGAMAIVGSLQDGLSGDASLLIAKAILDGIAAVVFAASRGKVIAAGPLGKYKTAAEMVCLPACILCIPFEGCGAVLSSSFMAVLAQIILWIALALAVLSCIDYIVRNKDVIDTTNI